MLSLTFCEGLDRNRTIILAMKNMKKLIFLTLTYVIPNLIYAQKQPLFQSESSFIIESVAKQGKVKTIRATSFDIINLSGQITAGKI